MHDWVQAFTDGSSYANRDRQGPGGWAAVWLYGGASYEQSGAAPVGDAYRMELTAILVALSVLPNGAKVVVTSDCQVVLHHAQSRTRHRDKDIWKAVDFHAKRMSDVRWVWTRGHAGNPFNQRADHLARAAARSVQS